MKFIIYFLIIFLLAIICAVIAWFIYSIKKKSIIGLVISGLILLLVIVLLSANIRDELSIKKEDVISDLSHTDIELKYDFRITNNKVSGIAERIQETEIQLDQRDKERIIHEIKNSRNFRSYESKLELMNDVNTDQSDTYNQVLSFQYPEYYSREIYGSIDHYPTWIWVHIPKKGKTLQYHRVEQ